VSEETTVELNKKQERFKNIAKKKTVKALEAIQSISDISRMTSVEPITEDVDKIVVALHDAIERMSEKLSGEQEEKEEFTL